ncbi:nucleotidyl transferase AbiEii/AbiGii toxin family protein [Mesotoga sp. H07pep.5.4]|uniref:nucleotidyl transferase AbiEii/AbiGii toxin family protein n=1 Tax=Mesotoga sp. H07pep.5.4 TaxID=1463664 RepID=UPI000EF15FB0|nr:nucleotidyl transferase AbiEii/AbiGii toxin family protein [Mesotoga sp. H07pep.5.4]RLL86643.1 abortive phage infection protein [Mesotoga sp. H07pep.5.4]
MINAEKLKCEIRKIASEKDLKAGEILHMFMFERFIERLARSFYRESFILKGGLLIASMIGIGQRTTIDMDTTVKNLAMKEDTLKRVLTEIIDTALDDGVSFKFERIVPIREEDEYNNFRVSLEARCDRIRVPVRIDMTTGDAITPGEIDYQYRTIFGKEEIIIKAYTLETILAEKYETILRRSVLSSRPRDLYDIHTLFRLKKDQISTPTLKKAIENTALRRGSSNTIADYESIVSELMESEYQKRLWRNYQNENSYAKGIQFNNVVQTVKIIGDLLKKL